MNATMTIGDMVGSKILDSMPKTQPPRLEIADRVIVKDFMSHGRNLGDVEMDVVLHTCNRVQLENPRLGFRGWFPMDSNRLIAVNSEEEN